jgi:DNA-binding NarL/FixJ family response regulator
MAEQINSLRPQTKVLFMSGYTDDAVVRHGVLAAEVAFLPKPFSANALVSKVRDVLDK